MSLLLKLRARVTPLINQVQRLLDLSMNDNIIIDDLDFEMHMLRQHYEQWSSLWTQVETYIQDDDTLEKSIKVHTDFEDLFQDAKSKLYIQRARMARARELRQQAQAISNSVTTTKDIILDCLKTFWERQDLDKKSGKTGASNTTKKKKPCRLCTGPHFTTACSVYPDIESRKNRLAEMNACITCAKAKHEDQCKPITCYICRGAHHSWFHLG